MNEYSEYLSHHGIKGMKWGVRHERPRSAKRKVLTDAEREKRKKIAKRVAVGVAVGAGAGLATAYAIKSSKNNSYARKTTMKERRKMSDEELLRRIGRLEKEQKLIELERSTDTRAQSEVSRILRNSGKVTMGTIATGAMVYTGKKIIGAAAGKEVVKEMFPKKK